MHSKRRIKGDFFFCFILTGGYIYFLIETKKERREIEEERDKLLIGCESISNGEVWTDRKLGK